MKPKYNKIGTHSSSLILVLLILGVLMVACGSGGGSSSEGGVGSISFDFVMATPQSSGVVAGQQLHQAEFPCEDNDVETIEAQVLDENEVLLAEGGPWPCTDGEGTISEVEAGDNRIVKIIARNSEGDIVFAGRSDPFSVQAGETTSVETIELVIASSIPVTNQDSAITDEDTAVIIPVLGNDPDTYYNPSGDYFGTLDPTTVAVVSNPLSGNTEVNADGTVRYIPNANSNGADSFTYTVQDDFGATSNETLVTVTVNPIPDVPDAPAGVTATPGIGQITLDWQPVVGATTYNVYFSTSAGVSKSNFEGVFRGVGQTSFTHSPLPGGETFFYVVTAQNDDGESDESAEVFATVPVNSRLIDDFSGTGFGSDPWTGLFDADFDGAGNGNYQDIATSDGPPFESSTLTYNLDVDGSLTSTLSDGTIYTGILNADNNILAVADTDFSDIFIEMDVLIKKSSGLTEAILNGEYIGVRISSFGSTALFSATFDGNSTGTFQYLADSGGQDLSGEFTYNVASDGGATINGLVAFVSEGIVSRDGTVVSIVDTAGSGDGELSMAVLIKTGVGLSNATIIGDYVGVSFGYFTSGVLEETTVTSISADGAGNMVFEILSNSRGKVGAFDATYDVDPSNGRITINLPDGQVYEGVVNGEGDIFNFVNTDFTDF
jgi:hypothetical protein